MNKVLAKAMKGVTSREEALELINESYPELAKEEVVDNEPEVEEQEVLTPKETKVVDEVVKALVDTEPKQVTEPKKEVEKVTEKNGEVEQLKKELAEQKVRNDESTKKMNELIEAYNNNVPFGMTKKITESDKIQKERELSANSVDDYISRYNNGQY